MCGCCLLHMAVNLRGNMSFHFFNCCSSSSLREAPPTMPRTNYHQEVESPSTKYLLNFHLPKNPNMTGKHKTVFPPAISTCVLQVCETERDEGPPTIYILSQRRTIHVQREREKGNRQWLLASHTLHTKQLSSVEFIESVSQVLCANREKDRLLS